MVRLEHMQLAILYLRGGEDTEDSERVGREVGRRGGPCRDRKGTGTFSKPGEVGFCLASPIIPDSADPLVPLSLFICRACSPLCIADQEEGLSTDSRPLLPRLDKI